VAEEIRVTKDVLIDAFREYGESIITDSISDHWSADLADIKDEIKGVKLQVAKDQRLASGDEDEQVGAKGGFRDFKDFLSGVVATQRGTPDERFKAESYIKLNEQVGAEGGFLVPPEFRAQLLQRGLGNAIIRPRATVIPMSRDTMGVPKVQETSRASSVFGGVIIYWEGEGDTATASEPKFGEVDLRARKMMGLTRVTSELLEDAAISLAPLLETMFGGAITWYEDNAFIEGDGVGKPLGIFNTGNAGLLAVTKESGQTADTIVYENLVKIFSRALPESMATGVWVAHPDTMPQLLQMARNTGVGTAPAVMVSGIEGAPSFNIFGRPVLFTEHMQTVGDQSDIGFIDPAHYLIGDRRALTVVSSIHESFTSDKVTWRFTQRIDGRPWVDSAITPKNGSTTISPYVTVAARA
jgi:HK97 family phage major capsid protein